MADDEPVGATGAPERGDDGSDILPVAEMLADPAFLDRLARATSISVASCDAEGLPTSCRAVGFEVGTDAASVIVHLPVATASRTIANVATNGRLAITCSNPIDHTTLQFKGRSQGVRLGGERDRETVAVWHRAFEDTLAEIGMPRTRTRALTTFPAFAVTIAVSAIYDQTPGPRAGVRIEGR